jgi:hypothetical protein
MARQPIIAQLAKHGPLPSAAERDVAKVRQVQTLLMQIDQPISNDDARILVTLFGPDDAFGLAWTLVHLIETAPDWPLWDVLNRNRQ